jgi:hypothetical protein
MLAQWRLRTGHAIDISDVALDKSPAASRDWLKACMGRNGKVQIGLERGYRLLADFGEDLGKAFGANAKLKALLKARNESILAHGSKPIEREACEDLLAEVETLARPVIPDFDRKSALLRFPWSK